MILDVLLISGVLMGFILIQISKKKPTIKGLKKIGIVLIIISLLIGLPDFLEGFNEGYIAGSKYGS